MLEQAEFSMACTELSCSPSFGDICAQVCVTPRSSCKRVAAARMANLPRSSVLLDHMMDLLVQEKSEEATCTSTVPTWLKK